MLEGSRDEGDRHTHEGSGPAREVVQIGTRGGLARPGLAQQEDRLSRASETLGARKQFPGGRGLSEKQLWHEEG
jgi:hypothetical protein